MCGFVRTARKWHSPSSTWIWMRKYFAGRGRVTPFPEVISSTCLVAVAVRETKCIWELFVTASRLYGRDILTDEDFIVSF